MRRRDFIRGTALAGLSAPLLTREGAASPPGGDAAHRHLERQRRAPAERRDGPGRDQLRDARHGTPQGGRDTLDAVIAGVDLVEDDPRRQLGGLRRAAERGGRRRARRERHARADATGRGRGRPAPHQEPSKVARLVMERTDHILLVGEGALRFALKHGFKKEDLLTEESRQAWLRGARG